MKLYNKRARFDYQIEDSFEAGIALTGTEVKSIRDGRGDISSAFVRLRGGEAWLIGANIPQSVHSSIQDYDPVRSRKILLHKEQLLSLGTKLTSKNLTLVPVSLYTKGRLVKAEIALGKGKKQFEKKEAKRRADLDREAEQALREKE